VKQDRAVSAFQIFLTYGYLDDRKNGTYVRLKISRYNPQVDAAPHFQNYVVPLTEEKTNLLQILEYIYRHQDGTLAFRRYCCGVQACNSCLMLVNGKQTHACLFIVEPETDLEVAPLPERPVLRDLIV